MNRPGIITTTNTIEEMGNPGISGMPPSIVTVPWISLWRRWSSR
jgi:hypothetical protein